MNMSDREKHLDAQLKTAVSIARKQHAGQKDKQGKPYIEHPMRVMNAVSGSAKIVAVLHDVLEDTDMTDQKLLDLGIDLDIVEDIRRLSRPDDMDYMDYIRTLRGHQRALDVKLADLHDNMRPGGLKRLYRRYEKAIAEIESWKSENKS